MKIVWSITVICCVIMAHVPAALTSDEPRKFDEFGDICCGDEKARLDAFALELQKNPEVRGYIIFYGGRRYPSCYVSRPRLPRRGEAEARVARMKPYLLDTRGVSSERIVFINGGYRESWMAELWIIPQAANPPTPTPTLQLKDIKFRKGRARERDYECNE